MRLETWLAGHLPIVRLRRAAGHLRVEVRLGGVRHWLDDRPLAAIAKSCGERPRHLVYGCARCKRVLGLTGCRCEWILSVEKDSAMQHHACQIMHTHTHTYTLFHKLQWHHRWMHSPRYGLIVNPLQMRGLTGGKKGENCLHVFSQQIMEHGESGWGLFEKCEHTLGTNIYLEIRPRSSLKDLLHFSCTLYLNGSKGKV